MSDQGNMKRRTRRPAARAGGLLRDRRGVIAIMLALLALPLICIIGLGIDYGLSVRAEALLNSAADAAAVAATDTAGNAANQTGITQSQIFAEGQAAGVQMFNAQVSNVPNVSTPVVTVTVTQPVAGSATFATTVTYTASYTTWFGSMFRVFSNAPNTPTFFLGGGSSAQITLTAYEDFHILMDTSGSMQIAATPADMAKLGPLAYAASVAAGNNTSPYNKPLNGSSSYMPQAAQGTNCAFGCHWDNSNTGCKNCDFYEIAENNGVTLRQDVEQTAVSDAITTMEGQDSINQYKVAVYYFNNGLTQQAALTSSLSAAATAATQVPPTWSDPNNEPDTSFGTTATALAAGLTNCPSGTPTYIPCPGDGATAATAKQFVFLITDGMEDYYGAACNNPSGRCEQPITQSECQILTNSGVQLLVLYVQYVPLDTSYNGVNYTNSWYQQHIQQYVDPSGNGVLPTPPSYDQVETNLQACASQPSYYIKANDSSGIEAALKTLLLAAENQGVRLTH